MVKDKKHQKDTYILSLANNLSDVGEYGILFTFEPNQRRGSNLHKKNDNLLTCNVSTGFFPYTEKTGQFYVTHIVYSIENNGNIVLWKTVSNSLNSNLIL